MGYKIKIRELTEEDYTEWDRLVKESSQGTIFHNSLWLSTLASVQPGEHKIIGCYIGEELVAGCTVRIYYNWPFKLSNAFRFTTPYDGVVIKPMPNNTKLRRIESFQRSIIESLSNYLRSEKFSFVRLINSPSLIDIRPFVEIGWTGRISYTYYLSLEGSSFENKFSRLVRRSIRKARAMGIEVTRSKDVDEYFKLFKKTLQRHRSRGIRHLPITYNFLEKMIPILYEKKIGEMWLAKTSSDETASGEILLFDNKRVYWWSASNDPQFYGTGAPAFLKLELMNELKERFTEIDMIEATTPGIADFKAGFNPKIVPHYIVEKSSNTYKAAKVIYRNIYWTIKGIHNKIRS